MAAYVSNAPVAGLPPALDIDANTPFGKPVLDQAFLYIYQQIQALQSFIPSWQDQIDILRDAGLVRLNDAIEPIYQSLASISQLGILFYGTTTSQLTMGLGSTTLIIDATDAPRFAAAGYLCIQDIANPAIYMTGLFTSYDRTSGTLVLNVDTVVGSGTYSSWQVFPAPNPAGLPQAVAQTSASAALVATDTATVVAALASIENISTTLTALGNTINTQATTIATAYAAFQASIVNSASVATSASAASASATAAATSATAAQNAAASISGGPVTSVNGKTGTPVLAASDVGAVPTSAKGTASGVATLDTNTLVPVAQLPLGVSIANPGTGKLEVILIPQTLVGAGHTFAQADLFLETRRSNGGAAMADTFPASTVAGLISGSKLVTNNVDPTATLTITAGSGTQVNGATSVLIGPARSVEWLYDTTVSPPTWRSTKNGLNSLLSSDNLSDVANIVTARANLGAQAALAINSVVNSGTITCAANSYYTVNRSVGAVTFNPPAAPNAGDLIIISVQGTASAVPRFAATVLNLNGGTDAFFDFGQNGIAYFRYNGTYWDWN